MWWFKKFKTLQEATKFINDWNIIQMQILAEIDGTYTVIYYTKSE